MAAEADVRKKLENEIKNRYRIQAVEEKENIYGFKRNLLADPVSTRMMSTIAIKRANPNKWEKLYNNIKKRQLQE